MGESRRRFRAALCLALAACVSAGAFAQDTYGPVNNETLWSIAKKVNEGKPGATAQMAWALYRFNPDAFEGSPSKIRSKATLKVPDAAFVNSVPAAQAYAYLTGAAKPPATSTPTPVPVLAAAPPAPALAATPPAPTPATAGRAPVITGVGLSPLAEGEPFQWLVVQGSGFAPGAMIEMREAGKAGAVTPRKPQSVRDGRIEYAARFPAQATRWQIAVRNPDGARSAAYEFQGGANVTLALGAPAAAAPALAATAPAPAPVAAGAFAKSPERAEAMRMAEAKQGAEPVYQYLAPLEDRYAGDVDYDYLLGTAALDSGHFSQAIFVLQRAVAVRPQFSGARMDLARAYYAQGDNESARREFDTLAKENPPPEAARAIAEYQAAIDRRAAVYEQQLGGYVEAQSGYDSNANGAPDTQDFLGFTLDSRNQATSSSYYGLGAGGILSYPFAPAWRLLGTGSANYRGNPDASFVDSQVLRLAGGVEWRPRTVEYSLQPNYTYAMLDGNENHQIVAVDGAATWHFDCGQLSTNLRFGQQRFVDELKALDVDTLVFGVAGQCGFQGFPRVQLVSAITAGSDEAVETGSPFSRDILGLRAGVIMDFGSGHSLLLSVSTLSADYNDPFPFLGQNLDRSDDQFGASLGYEWGRFRAMGWTLRGQLNYVKNDSSIDLYNYDRIDAGVSVRREFR